MLEDTKKTTPHLLSGIITWIDWQLANLKNWYYNYIKFLDRWFSYYKVLRDVYDFDHSSILAVEEHQLIRVRDSIIRYHNYVNYNYDVNRINLALYLLEIIKEEGKIVMTEGKWYCPVYANTKNANRFNSYVAKNLNNSDLEYVELMKGYLYTEKAWHLYYKLREQYTRNWWV